MLHLRWLKAHNLLRSHLQGKTLHRHHLALWLRQRVLDTFLLLFESKVNLSTLALAVVVRESGLSKASIVCKLIFCYPQTLNDKHEGSNKKG